MEGSYALAMFGLPVVRDLHSLADEMSLSVGLLHKLWAANHRFYRRFEVPKKGGGSREILSPSRDMKAAQAWILRNILDKLGVHEAATGFRKGRSVVDNAAPHVHNRYFLCMDIENFFPSIPYSKVYGVFRGLGYSRHVAHILSHLCTCDGRLPQGAVTSPALSNTVCIRFDRRISAFVGRRNIAYTRYADDLTFSSMSPSRLVAIMPTIRHIVQDEGFALNTGKTRRMGPRQQCRVTGLVVSGGQAGVGRARKRRLRAAIHRLLQGQLGPDERAAQQAHVQGWLAFVNAVDAKGSAQLRSYAAALAERHGIPDLFSP